MISQSAEERTQTDRRRGCPARPVGGGVPPQRIAGARRTVAGPGRARSAGPPRPSSEGRGAPLARPRGEGRARLLGPADEDVAVVAGVEDEDDRDPAPQRAALVHDEGDPELIVDQRLVVLVIVHGILAAVGGADRL